MLIFQWWTTPKYFVRNVIQCIICLNNIVNHKHGIFMCLKCRQCYHDDCIYN